MRKFVLPIILQALAWPVAASQPGEPLDCSDWVFCQLLGPHDGDADGM